MIGPPFDKVESAKQVRADQEALLHVCPGRQEQSGLNGLT